MADQSEHLIFKREELILAFRLDKLNASVTIDSGGHEGISEAGSKFMPRCRQMKLYLEKMHVEQIRWAYRSKTTLRLNGAAVEAEDSPANGSFGGGGGDLSEQEFEREKEKVFALTSGTGEEGNRALTKPQIIYNYF